MFDHSNLYKSSPEEEEIAAGNGITPVRLFIHLKLLPAKDLEDVNLLERNEGKSLLQSRRPRLGSTVYPENGSFRTLWSLSDLSPLIGYFFGGEGESKGEHVSACMHGNSAW